VRPLAALRLTTLGPFHAAEFRSKVNNFAAQKNTSAHDCIDERQLEAILWLCNTDSARSRAGPLHQFLTDNARMAKSADAADLKSAGRKAVGVQVPLWAPRE
jgi:hypothetical protein